MIKVMKAIAVLLVFSLAGVEVNAQTDPQATVIGVPLGQLYEFKNQL